MLVLPQCQIYNFSIHWIYYSVFYKLLKSSVYSVNLKYYTTDLIFRTSAFLHGCLFLSFSSQDFLFLSRFNPLFCFTVVSCIRDIPCILSLAFEIDFDRLRSFNDGSGNAWHFVKSVPTHESGLHKVHHRSGGV